MPATGISGKYPLSCVSMPEGYGALPGHGFPTRPGQLASALAT
jgi:hypothetical protein